MKTTLLIDADITCFQHAARNQENYDWGDETTSKHVEDIEDVKPLIQAEIDGLMSLLKADDYLLCLSDDMVNWRKTVLPTYKGQRTYSERPELLYPLKEWMAAELPSYRRPTLEADDVMGILSTHPKLIPGKKIIVSIDKDMKTIPGWLYNPDKDTKARLVSREEADEYHLLQALMGDATDGYKGCPGIGPGTAAKAFADMTKLVPFHQEITKGKNKGDIRTTYVPEPADSLWEIVVSYYLSKGLTEEDALVQARVARICRYTDYNYTSKEVILWEPPK